MSDDVPDVLHVSHRTIVTDASSYDERCVLCGATDRLGSWGNLRFPCPASGKARAEYDMKIAREAAK